MDEKDGGMFPQPFSTKLWEMLIINSKDPVGVCVAVKKLEGKKIDDLNQYLSEKDWKTSSVLLTELRKAEEFGGLCKNFLKE